MFYYKIEKDIEMRILDVQHAKEMYQLTDACREHLREWLPWVDGTKGPENSREFITFTKKQFANNQGFHAGIWVQGKFAGVIGYHKIDWISRSTALGYWLAPEYQGKGIMTKAVKIFTEYAIKDLMLNRVEIRCAEGNLKSRGIPERLGYKKEGMIREAEWLYDHYVDHIVYGMLRRDWK